MCPCRIAGGTAHSEMDNRHPRAPFAAESSIGLLTALVGDGRPLLVLVALGLMLSGIFALFLSATGTFLPHDVSFLGMQPGALCDLHQCRIVHFIFHDRVSFGGTLMAIGALYLWLLAFPLRQGGGVGVVDAAALKHCGLSEFSGLPDLRLPRLVARCCYCCVAAALSRRHLEDTWTSARATRGLAQPAAARYADGSGDAGGLWTSVSAIRRGRHGTGRVGDHDPWARRWSLCHRTLPISDSARHN